MSAQARPEKIGPRVLGQEPRARKGTPDDTGNGPMYGLFEGFVRRGAGLRHGTSSPFPAASASRSRSPESHPTISPAERPLSTSTVSFMCSPRVT